MRTRCPTLTASRPTPLRHLPWPCLPPDPRAGGSIGDQPAEEPDSSESCTGPKGVQRLVFDKDKYPNVRKHFRFATRKGWPRRLIINRPGADARRDRLLKDVPTKDGYDRDQYPPAVGRGKGKGLERGRNPRGWKAHVHYVPSTKNRSRIGALEPGALPGLIVAIAGFIVLLVLGGGALIAMGDSAESVASVTTGAFGVIGSVIGAYFGVQAGLGGRKERQDAHAREATKSQMLAAMLPEVQQKPARETIHEISFPSSP